MASISSITKEGQTAATAPISPTEIDISIAKLYASLSPKDRARVDEFIDFLRYSRSHRTHKEEQTAAAAAAEINTQRPIVSASYKCTGN